MILIYTAVISIIIVYIQSIGSSMDVYSGLFIFSFFPIDLTNVLYLSLSTPVITSQRLQQFSAISSIF